MKFKQKPVEIEAMHLVGSNGDYHTVYCWVEDHVGSFSPMVDELPVKGISIDPETGFMLIATFDGVRYAKPGDWIVKNQHGEFYPLNDDVFKELYEPLETSEKQSDLNLNDVTNLHDAVGTALGFASVCWDPIPTGMFQSDRASKAVNTLVKWIAHNYRPTKIASPKLIVNDDTNPFGWPPHNMSAHSIWSDRRLYCNDCKKVCNVDHPCGCCNEFLFYKKEKHD